MHNGSLIMKTLSCGTVVSVTPADRLTTSSMQNMVPNYDREIEWFLCYFPIGIAIPNG